MTREEENLIEFLSAVKDGGALFRLADKIIKERDEYALLIFQPCGESHHNALKCPYCQENKENL